MGRTVVESVETAGMDVRMLGPTTITRAGVAVPLPRSRKVRGLLAFLALSPQPVSRARLCDLLWDVPNDPRGELRWCLSKLRGLLDDGARRRVVTADDHVALDLGDCRVDVLELDKAARGGMAEVPHARLAELCQLFSGDLLDGVMIDGNPEFTGWLSAQRNRYRALHVEVLRALAACAPGSDEVFRHLEGWLQIAPFDPRAHEVMLEVLVACGRHHDAEQHLATTIRSFEDE